MSPDLVAALATGGILEPFPIQALTIPPALAGRDVCGKAQTGSGKTLAFGLPLVERTSRAAPRRPRALVLVPTRELAQQVRLVLAPLGEARGLRVAAVFGGAPMERQVKALRRGVDIVIATPGRLIDLGDRGDLSVADVGILVLDEADRMADMGFLPQVQWVLRRLPADHQTLLFSATLDGDVDHLVRAHTTDPVRCEVESGQPTVEAMEHRFVKVHEMDKVKVAAAIARAAFRTLLFVRTKRGADRLVLQLRREGLPAGTLHSGLTQGARQRALGDFSRGDVGTLVATDIAARGLDVDGVDVVVHFDPPEDHKAYLHRSGRTARAGGTGVVVSLLLWDQLADVERMRRRLSLRHPVVELFSNDERLADLTSWGHAPEVTEAVEAATGTDGGAPAARTLPRRRPGPAGRRRR